MMNTSVARELVRIAKLLQGMEFDSEKERDDYKKKHKVKPETKLTVKKDTSGKPSSTKREKAKEKRMDTWKKGQPISVDGHEREFHHLGEDGTVFYTNADEHGMYQATPDRVEKRKDTSRTPSSPD